MDAVTLSEVTKDYGDVRALDQLDLAIEAGRITTVLGPNGAGKTTAVDIMLGLRRPTFGTVEVLDAGPNEPAVRARVGAMLQEPGYPEATTPAELLRLVASAYPDPLRVDEAVQRAELTGLADRRIAQLSGGQRQRVGFALALVGNPDVLFLDEPTVALDVEARRRFWEQVRDLADAGRTVVFTTHYLAEADEVADRVVVVHRGRVLADGTPRDVKQLVAGRTVRLSTSLSGRELARLPGVEHVDDDAGRPGPGNGVRPVTLHTTDAEAAIVALVRGGHPLRDLAVHEAALEDAFVHLTRAA